MKLKLSTTSFKRSKKIDKKSLGGGKRRQKRLGTSPLTFLVFFALASAFWVLNRMQTKLSRELDIAVSLKALPLSYSVENHYFQDTIHLRVLDLGFQHIRYDINGLSPITLPLRYDKNNRPYLALSKEELKQEIAMRLSPTAFVQRQSVESYHLDLEPRKKKKVPIKLQADLEVESGYAIVSQTLIPDSVVVYGERSVLDTLQALKSVYLENQGLTTSLSQKLKLALPYGVNCDSDEVLVNVEVEELTEQVFTCPIRKLNVPEGLSLIALPSNVVVRMTLPRSYHTDLREADIIPTIDYKATLGDKELSELKVVLKDCPKFISSVHIEPESVQFVVEKK